MCRACLVIRRPARASGDARNQCDLGGPNPNKKINGEGYWTSMGNDPVTGGRAARRMLAGELAETGIDARPSSTATPATS